MSAHMTQSISGYMYLSVKSEPTGRESQEDGWLWLCVG